MNIEFGNNERKLKQNAKNYNAVYPVNYNMNRI